VVVYRIRRMLRARSKRPADTLGPDRQAAEQR
jgi:hypothetical protein